MTIDKARAIIAAVWFAVGCVCVFFMGKGVYHQPLDESATRDTVRIVDTIPHYYPKPVAEERLRYVTRYLPVAQTVGTTDTFTMLLHDTVAVEVPITQKHYRALEYDAYVSGYEANLDSIFVYRQREFITEVRTISKPPNKWELDLITGIDYSVKSQRYTPYAGGELMYKPNRLQIGLQGGIVKGDKVEPFVGGKAKLRIL